MGRYVARGGCHDIKQSANFLAHIVDANGIQKGECYIIGHFGNEKPAQQILTTICLNHFMHYSAQGMPRLLPWQADLLGSKYLIIEIAFESFMVRLCDT